MRRVIPALLLALVIAAVSASPAAAANPWLQRRVLNMAHQGGESENPSNTMYAYRQSLADGADMLEIDVHATADDRVVALHDSKVDRTTNGAGSVYDMSLGQLQALDGAYNFIPGRNAVPGQPASAYPFRGVRTGPKRPPRGFSPRDFRVPTLEEVLAAFPNVPVNIEIKGKSDLDEASFLRNAELVADVLEQNGRTDVIVVSFKQEAVDYFHRLAPRIPLAPGIVGAGRFFGTGLSAGPGVVALQVPPKFGGVTIVTPSFVRRAHAAGYAVHVWFSGQEESERVYNEMLDMGVDGMMPAKPEQLERVLCRRRAPRAAGNPNHCGGRASRAAGGCAVRATRLGRVARSGRVRLRLRRARRARVRCRGSVSLQVRHRGRGGRRRNLTVARRAFVLRSGRRSLLTSARVSRAGRGLLEARPRGVRVTAVVRVKGRRAVSRRRLVLRAAR